jgi:hypothetical protein
MILLEKDHKIFYAQWRLEASGLSESLVNQPVIVLKFD